MTPGNRNDRSLSKRLPRFSIPLELNLEIPDNHQVMYFLSEKFRKIILKNNQKFFQKNFQKFFAKMSGVLKNVLSLHRQIKQK